MEEDVDHLWTGVCLAGVLIVKVEVFYVNCGNCTKMAHIHVERSE